VSKTTSLFFENNEFVSKSGNKYFVSIYCAYVRASNSFSSIFSMNKELMGLNKRKLYNFLTLVKVTPRTKEI